MKNRINTNEYIKPHIGFFSVLPRVKNKTDLLFQQKFIENKKLQTISSIGVLI